MRSDRRAKIRSGRQMRQVGGQPASHPAMKANLLMGAVVLALLLMAVVSTVGGR